ncbi:MAG: carbohydrate kinase family protein [Blastocatellia bacterium]
MSREPRKRWEVLTVGDVFVDLVLSGFVRWPAPGEEVQAQSLLREVGGGAAITACGLGRLGVTTGLFAAVGSDGDWLRHRIAEHGVDQTGLQAIDEETTALTVAVSTREDRSFFTYTGANRWLPKLLASGALERRLLQEADHVHFALPIDPGLLRELAAELHACGTTLSLDVGWVEEWLRDPASLAVLSTVDLFLPNEREGEAMTGEVDPAAMLARFAEAGARMVVLKRGAQGAMVRTDGEIVIALPPPVTPVDTTGAGDCFDAGFLAAWRRRLSLKTCLEVGNLCGALSTTAPGGLAGFPTDAARYLREGDRE